MSSGKKFPRTPPHERRCSQGGRTRPRLANHHAYRPTQYGQCPVVQMARDRRDQEIAPRGERATQHDDRRVEDMNQIRDCQPCPMGDIRHNTPRERVARHRRRPDCRDHRRVIGRRIPLREHAVSPCRQRVSQADTNRGDRDERFEATGLATDASRPAGINDHMPDLACGMSRPQVKRAAEHDCPRDASPQVEIQEVIAVFTTEKPAFAESGGLSPVSYERRYTEARRDEGAKGHIAPAETCLAIYCVV